MSSEVLIPKFSSSIIEDNRSDGYWVEKFHFKSDDRVPGLITSGLVSGVIEYLENPIAAAEAKKKAGGASEADPAPNPCAAWQKYEIGKFNSPVAVVAVDINKNGLMDLVICHDYGPFMLECDPLGGHVTWLENPGRDKLKDGHWKERYIGRWPAMHRMKAGYFTQKTFLEVIAASVVYGQHDKTTPIPIIRFQAPENVLTASEWHREVIDDENFTVIHEVTQKKFNGPNGLDSMLISSREGTTWLYYENGKWHRQLITIGEPRAPGQSETSESPGSGDHWGTGCADAGKVGDDPFAYIATLDPFHGTTCCVYTKEGRGLNGNACGWKRHILDVYGTPNQLQKTGDGPGHYIVCADFDGDGDEEFLLSLFGPLNRDETGESIPPKPGPDPNKGIMYYKAIDLEKGIFAKWRIADESSARIAIGDFNGKGRIDLASMGYNVKRYYEEPSPVLTIHMNEFAPVKAQKAESVIVPTVWDNEGMIYLANPAQVTTPSSLPLIEIANYTISVEVHPPKSKITLGANEGIKVLYGLLKDGDKLRQPLGNKPFPFSASILTEGSAGFVDDEKGAIILRFTPTDVGCKKTWPTAADVPVNLLFSASKSDLSLPPFKFTKVEDLWWGSSFKGVDFYNMSGFHFRFLEDKTPIAHMQFWTAGKGVNCGVHNHGDCMFEEIHICLSQGTGTGGMSLLKDKYYNTPVDELNKLPAEAFEHLVLEKNHEHGGMWHRDSYGKAVRGLNNVVSYPWHKWQAGKGEGVDVWLALEFNPDLEGKSEKKTAYVPSEQAAQQKKSMYRGCAC